MSERRSLPSRPDLRHLRDEAKRRRKAGEFPSIALAQLAIAREHGFRSWPRLKFRVEALTLDASERAAALIASATSADLRRARALLAADPALARHDLACACTTGEADGIAGDPELTRMLLEAGADPTDEREERDGYHGNEVLYHACEFPDPTCARLVIEAGSRQDLIDYNLGRALNFPNPEMVEMFC